MKPKQTNKLKSLLADCDISYCSHHERKGKIEKYILLLHGNANISKVC